MRAERLLRIMLLLQSRGQMTAGALARDLEVSARTIQRDMEALSGAGIPVYAVRGGAGGWSLLKDYRTSLTGMTAAEALAVVVGRPPRLLADLGLHDQSEAGLLKLMAAIPPSTRLAAEHARQRIHVDLAPWGQTQPNPSCLPQLQQAIWDNHQVRIRYATSPSSFVVAPLGLVAKGTVWYLVGLRARRDRTYRVSRIRSVQITDQRFERPASFDLATHWRNVNAGLADTWPSYPVTLLLRGEALIRIQWAPSRTREIGEPDANGWARAHVDLENEPEARSVVLGLSPDVVVVAPMALRHATTLAARAFAERNDVTHIADPD